MKKSIFKKIGGLFLGLAMGLGVVTGVAAGNKASEVKAENQTLVAGDNQKLYTHDFSTKPSGTTTLSGVSWTFTAGTNLNGYNSGNYKGVQLGAKSKTGEISMSLTSWGSSGDFAEYTKIVKIALWLNNGNGTISATVKVDNTTCSKSGSVSKNSAATSQRDGTSKVEYTPVAGHESGNITIDYSATSGGGYFCAIQILCEKEVTTLPLSISGDSTVYNGKNITLSASSNGAAVSGVTWSSSNTGVATVDSSSGVVTGVGGTTSGTNVTITAKKDGYADATKTITVKADTKTLKSISASVSVEHSTFTLGDSFATTGLVVMGTYSHTNGDPDSEEQITSGITTSPTAGTKLNTVGPQTVTVNAGGKSTTYSINVNYAAVESIQLDYNEGTLGKGGEATLPGVTILPANANQDYSWGNAVATEGIIYSYNPSTHELAIDANNTVEGTIQFTATATGDSSKEATVVYTVQAAQIANITGVTASATGTIVAKQYVGDAFNAQGFSFAPTWSEGDHDVVVITANDISWNALVAGSNPTGTYSCADGEFTVTITGVTVVNDTLVSIAFAEGCDMTNKSYYVGDSWDFSGLSIVGTMDSGKTAPAIASSNVTFSSNDAVATDTTSITVTAEYNNLTATKEISGIVVNEVTMDSLTVTYTGGKPYLGADFVFAGTIKGNMSNGTQQNVSVSDVDFDVNPYITDQQTVTATHKTTGATGTFNVQYQAKSYSSTTTEEKTLIVRASDVGGTNNSYALKDWTVGGVSGKSYTYASTSSASAFQFNGSKGTNIFYNTSAIPGKIKSVKMTKSSGTDRGGVEVFVHTSAMTSSNYTNGTSLGSKTVTTAGVTWSVLTTNTNNNVYLYVHYPTTNALYVSQVEITYEKTTTVTSSEKHAIRIGDVTCSKSPLIAGETISKSDFKIQVQYDTGTALTSNLVPTSVSPATLLAGTHDYTITYTGSYNDTVTKVIQLTAQAPAVLESISITKDAGCDDVFTRNDAFTHNGIHVIAHYTDSTTYPDADVTADADIPAPSNMNVAGTKTINVSYEENGVTKTTSYQITVNPIVSTYLTLSGEGIEGSNGVYTLKSGVENEVQLAIDKDGDEEIEVTNPTTFLSFDDTSNILTVNSQTTTSESGTITFTVGSLTASLTVNVSAAEGIQNLGDDEIVAYVGSSFSYDINIQLNNVESATWTLPQGDFVIESETEDNTGFVGTIYFTDEVSDTLTFSALTGKGKTLSVDIEVLAVNDDIKSISASLKSGVTYTAGQGQTFSKDDLTVTYERDSGADGTLLSSEFTVSGLPEGSFNRVASYQLTITSVENTEATDSVTISVGMPEGENLVTSSTSYTPGTPTTSWSKLTAASQLNAAEKVYIHNDDKGYVSGYSSSDATVVDNLNSCIKFDVIIVDSNEGTFRLCDPTSKKEISNLASNKFTISADSGKGAVFTVDGDGELKYVDSNGDERRLYANGNYLRNYKTSDSYDPFIVYISKTTPGQGTYNTTYSNNAMTATLYNFIALANETYANVCGSEGNNQKPDLTTWRSVLESDEYNALVADTNSYNLLKSAICGEGAYGSNGVYVASGEKQSSDMVIEFLQKYDRVVSNYPSENYNYLERDVTSGTATGASALFKNMLSNLGLDVMFNEENAPTSWVLLVTIAVAGLATGGYFYIRKRKED